MDGLPYDPYRAAGRGLPFVLLPLGFLIAPAAPVAGGGPPFVLDPGNDRLLKIGQDGGVAATIDSASTKGLDLRQPLALSSDGHRLFIANSLASDVVVLDLSGAVEKVIRLEPLAVGGQKPGAIGG